MWHSVGQVLECLLDIFIIARSLFWTGITLSAGHTLKFRRCRNISHPATIESPGQQFQYSRSSQAQSEREHSHHRGRNSSLLFLEDADGTTKTYLARLMLPVPEPRRDKQTLWPGHTVMKMIPFHSSMRARGVNMSMLFQPEMLEMLNGIFIPDVLV